MLSNPQDDGLYAVVSRAGFDLQCLNAELINVCCVFTGQSWACFSPGLVYRKQVSR